MTLTEFKRNLKENMNEVRKTYPNFGNIYLYRLLCDAICYGFLSSNEEGGKRCDFVLPKVPDDESRALCEDQSESESIVYDRVDIITNENCEFLSNKDEK